MALTTPSFIPAPWANSGEYEDIPVTTDEEGRASWTLGFPPETAIPQASGGIPPNRLDFQGAFHTLSQHTVFQQSGSLYTWSASLDYIKGAHILGSNGIEYVAVQASTGQNPVKDTSNTYWKKFSLTIADLIYPVGSIYMSMNSTNPASLFGGRWSALPKGRMLLSVSSKRAAGDTGGSETHAITEGELPSHKHTCTIKTAGNHTHTRGSMEIEGTYQAPGLLDAKDHVSGETTGCFYNITKGSEQRDADCTGSNTYGLGFQASRGWTGSTSSNGAHTHTVDVGNTGSGTAMNIMPPYIVCYMWQRIA